jgi:hypothetical protein
MIAHLSGAGSTTIATGPGTVTGISINTGTAGDTLTLHDGTSAVGPVLAVIDGAVERYIGATWSFVTGLFAVAVGTGDFTLSFSQKSVILAQAGGQTASHASERVTQAPPPPSAPERATRRRTAHRR